MSDIYEKRGVSSQKEDVHKAIKNIDKGLFPKAFCKVIPDYLSNDDKYCIAMHADGAGTKSSLAYIYWKETGNLDVWNGIAQDSIVMNLDDMICAGFTGPFLLSGTIGRNKKRIPSEVLGRLINGTQEFCDEMQKHGVNIITTGGETADLGDLVRTVVVDSTMTARGLRSEVIDNANIIPGDVIVGLESFGQAIYETEYNGGMGSNGLTSARHDVFDKIYRTKYPESYDDLLEAEYAYTGTKKLTDKMEGLDVDAGKLVLSPTRTYAPILIEILKKYRNDVHGMIHCTGGAQTKILHFTDNLHIIKDNLFERPPLFKMIADLSPAGEKELYSVFNLGHRLEIYLPKSKAQSIIEVSKKYGIDAKIIGYIEKSDKKKLTIKDGGNVFSW